MALDEAKARRIIKQTILDAMPELIDTVIERLKAENIVEESKELEEEKTKYIEKPLFSPTVLKAASQTNVEDLDGLPMRAYNVLVRKRSGEERKIVTVADLYAIPDAELLKYRNMGEKLLSSVNKSLALFASKIECGVIDG